MNCLSCVIVTDATGLIIETSYFVHKFMVPTRTGKHGKMRKLFPVMEKSGNLTQNTGKMREFDPKYWKNEEILPSFYF